DDAPDRVRGRFDLILLAEMLYYVRDYQRTLERTVDTFLAPGGAVFIALAMGRGYFHRRGVVTVRRLLDRLGLRAVCDERIDYLLHGIPKCWFPLCFAQESKRVLLYRRSNSFTDRPGPR